MATIKVKGHEFEQPLIKESFNRRAVQFKNAIIETLKKVDISEDQIDIKIEPLALKKMPASATWYMQGHRMYYSYELAGKFVDNLYVISKVIALEVETVLNKQKTIQDFIGTFSEEDDIEETRKKARETL